MRLNLLKIYQRAREEKQTINEYERDLCEYANECSGIRDPENFERYCLNRGKDCPKIERMVEAARR